LGQEIRRGKAALWQLSGMSGAHKDGLCTRQHQGRAFLYDGNSDSNGKPR
jgi:hypothetical protein